MHQKNPHTLGEECICHGSMIELDKRCSLGVKKREHGLKIQWNTIYKHFTIKEDM